MKNQSGVGIVRGPSYNDRKHVVSCPLCGWKLELIKVDALTSVASELSVPHVEWKAIGEDKETPCEGDWEFMYNEHVAKHQPAEWLHLIHSLDNEQATYRDTADKLNDFLDNFADVVANESTPQFNSQIKAMCNGILLHGGGFVPEQLQEYAE